MNKLYALFAVLTLASCGDLDPMKLADGYCDCYKKYGQQPDLSWKCDTLAQQNARKLHKNEEAQRAYNVRLRDCLNGE